MALVTRHGDVQAHQREVRQVMVKQEILAPGIDAMTGGALLAEFSRVHVAGGMAVAALRAKLLLGNGGRMASVTVDLRVRSAQLIMTVTIVIECHGLPCVRVMALITRGTETSSVRVFGAVAADAIARQWILDVCGRVAVFAVELRMNTFERKAGLLGVIVSVAGPGDSIVAGGAVGAAIAGVYVVRRMARGAPRRSPRVPITEVARRTACLAVRVAQRKMGLAVIEEDGRPDSRPVTGAAVLAQFAGVRFIALMTVSTRRACLAELLSRHMAGAAIGGQMGSGQREICLRMIECGRAQLDDVGLAAKMLRMTRAALRRSDARQSAMKAPVRGQVGGHFFVASHAKRRLPATICAIVALRTFLFELRMGGSYLTGHQ